MTRGAVVMNTFVTVLTIIPFAYMWACLLNHNGNCYSLIAMDYTWDTVTYDTVFNGIKLVVLFLFFVGVAKDIAGLIVPLLLYYLLILVQSGLIMRQFFEVRGVWAGLVYGIYAFSLNTVAMVLTAKCCKFLTEITHGPRVLFNRKVSAVVINVLLYIILLGSFVLFLVGYLAKSNCTPVSYEFAMVNDTVPLTETGCIDKLIYHFDRHGKAGIIFHGVIALIETIGMLLFLIGVRTEKESLMLPLFIIFMMTLVRGGFAVRAMMKLGFIPAFSFGAGLFGLIFTAFVFNVRLYIYLRSPEHLQRKDCSRKKKREQKKVREAHSEKAADILGKFQSMMMYSTPK